MFRFILRVGASVGRFARRRPAVASILAVLVTGSSSFAQSGTTSSLPTNLQPAAMVTNAMTEASLWLVVAIPVVVGLYMLSRLVQAFRRGAGRSVKG